jgi:hypothetical protein
VRPLHEAAQDRQECGLSGVTQGSEGRIRCRADESSGLPDRLDRHGASLAHNFRPVPGASEGDELMLVLSLLGRDERRQRHSFVVTGLACVLALTDRPLKP